MFCYHCGKQIEDGSRFCLYCGQDQTLAETPAGVPDSAAAPVPDDTCEMPVITSVPVEPLSSETPESLVEELSRIMKPAAPEETGPVAVEIPDIPEVPRAPIPPLETFAPAAPTPAPQPPVQPIAPVAPAAPVYNPAPVYAPAVPAQQPQPPRKKTWLVWLLMALSVVLVAGAVAAVLLFSGSGHKKAIEALEAVAFDGDFSQIEELAPAEYWNLLTGDVSTSQLTYQGDVWKLEVLPAKLQAQFGSKTNMHYDSFRMPSAMEIRSDEEATPVEQQALKTYLALYGISSTRVEEVRKLETEIVITGMSNGIKQELCQAETLYSVEIDGHWYLMDENGSFAVDAIVGDVLSKMK